MTVESLVDLVDGDAPAEPVPWPTLAADVDPVFVMIATEGAGGVLDECGRTGRWPWSGRWISNAAVLVAADVEALTVADRG